MEGAAWWEAHRETLEAGWRALPPLHPVLYDPASWSSSSPTTLLAPTLAAALESGKVGLELLGNPIVAPGGGVYAFDCLTPVRWCKLDPDLKAPGFKCST